MSVRTLIVAAGILLASSAGAIPSISWTGVNYRHFGWDADAFPLPVPVTEGWDLIAEARLTDVDDPLATVVTVTGPGPLGTISLRYYGSLNTVPVIHAYVNSFYPVLPSEIPQIESNYTFQVGGGPSTVHTVSANSFVNLQLPITTWDPVTGLLSWESVPGADLYRLYFYGYDQANDDIFITGNISLGLNTSYLLGTGLQNQILGVQALDGNIQTGLLVNQSHWFTYVVPEPATACLLAAGLLGLLAVSRRNLTRH